MSSWSNRSGPRCCWSKNGSRRLPRWAPQSLGPHRTWARLVFALLWVLELPLQWAPLPLFCPWGPQFPGLVAPHRPLEMRTERWMTPLWAPRSPRLWRRSCS
ncbi:splicing factor 3b subunit 2 [Phyllostomus discolor]|uniref:Splicing factor 3b subunit 2 n=1 Tax=Phyllostomus discolor TaxID=89673 RepID=A0A834E757_9CHIR|nr:splicing factor 3b subunit 2 [Phyllostomus discolor]